MQPTQHAYTVNPAPGNYPRSHIRARITCPADAVRCLPRGLGDADREQVHLLLLDNKTGLIADVTLYQGTHNACPVRVAEAFREALRYNTASMIVVHNHPSGDTTPSAEDLRVTRDLVAAGELLDVPVLDHIIVGGDAYASLREHSATWG